MKKSLFVAALVSMALLFGNAGAQPVFQSGQNIQKSDPIQKKSGFSFNPDTDKDGVPLGEDNCPGVSNSDQKDENHNGVGDECPVSLTGNGLSFCALLDGGKVRCWGKNGQGELATFSRIDQPAPATILQLNKFKEVAFSWSEARACGILDTAAGKRVACWGVDVKSYKTPQQWVTHDHPELIESIGGGAKDLAIGYRHDCMVSFAGKLYCWGVNTSGQTGQASEPYTVEASEVDGLDNVTAAAAGRDHTCAIANGDQVYCWGENGQGQLGDPQENTGHKPRLVPHLGKVKALWAGLTWTCAKQETDVVKCWGVFPESDPEDMDHPTADAVPRLKGAKKVIESEMVFCGLLEDGEVTCTSKMASMKDLAGGAFGACVLQEGGAVFCWNALHSTPVSVKF